MSCSVYRGLGCALLLGFLAGLPSVPRAIADQPGELLDAVADQQKASRGLLRREVELRISAALKEMSQDPTGVIQDLKSLDDLLRSAADLSAEERTGLRAKVSQVLRQSSRRLLEQESAEQERLARAATARDKERALTAIESEQARLEQLTKRFIALLDEGRLELAESTANIASESPAADSPIRVSMPSNASLLKNAHDALTTRLTRQRGVVDTLHRAEVAHIPQSDEPPIVYIDAAQWQELSLRRRTYAADFYDDKPAEAKIRKALDNTTDCNFNETALSDVIDYLKDLHGIEIQLDTKSLELMGVGSEVPVTLNVRGISLRSALRLLMRQLDLAYIIQDEVLLITTPDVAAATIVPKAYDVADLVLPIHTPNMSSAFGGVVGGGGNSPFGQSQGNQNNSNPFGNNQGNNPFGQNGQNLF